MRKSKKKQNLVYLVQAKDAYGHYYTTTGRVFKSLDKAHAKADSMLPTWAYGYRVLHLAVV